jgi:putative peptidoglycan lipid II flippase
MPSASASKERSFISGAKVVAGLTLVSRIMGLVRDMICSRVFGAGAEWSAFALAFLIPNLFRRLFGEGALSAAFIPTYARLEEEDPEQAKRFARAVMLTAMTALTALVIAGELILLALFQTSLGETGRLPLRLAMIMLPYMPLICAVALLGGLLQTHGRFAPTAGAPILLNLCIITASLAVWGDIHAVSVSVLIAGLLQAGWALIALRRVIDWRGPMSGAAAHVRSMLKLMGPMVLGLGALQINTFVDGLIAGYAVTFGDTLPAWAPAVGGEPYPLDEAANAVLFYAQRLYQFPLGVFGIAIATAIYPSLSRQASDPVRFRDTLRRGLRLSAFIAVPAGVGLILVARPLAATLFLGGEFDATGVDRVATVLVAYATAVWAYSLSQVLTRAYFAQGDSVTPVRVSLVFVGLNLALNLILIWPLQESGLAWSTAICQAGQVCVLLVLLHRRPELAATGVVDRSILRSWGVTIGLSCIMALAVAAAMWLPLPDLGGPWRQSIARLALAVVIGAVIYVIAAAALRRPELRWIVRRGS